MTFKCVYGGKDSCQNCEHWDSTKTEFNIPVRCQHCSDFECPIVLDLPYSQETADTVCENCLFEPKKTTVENKPIQDSGERREFASGAVRDMASGKGLMVVMPANALLRLSKHYEHGAQKYGKFNWQKGIPTSSFIDSTLRHIMKYLDGWDDEDHLAAAAFNILGAMEMEAKKPDMQDIPARENKKTFNYGE